MADLIRVSNTENGGRVADVLFIHGLDGDPRATWTTPGIEKGCWPKWLGADLADVGIWSVGYAVKSWSWTGYSMALKDRARNILDMLAVNGFGAKPLVFVVHSFGGLVVKQMLYTAEVSVALKWKDIAGQTRGVAFLATPHTGSRLANWIRWIPFYLPTVTVGELEDRNPELRKLASWYLNHHVRHKLRAKGLHRDSESQGRRPRGLRR